jgi:vacuolar-type H+-ATPase subunit H
MTATEEALAAMAKAEENWNKMVDRTVEVGEQFIKECEEFQKEQREWYLEMQERKNTK